MPWLDLVIVAIITLSVLIGLFRGFIKEAISLATWIAALWVAIAFSDDLARMLPERLDAVVFDLGGMNFEFSNLRIGMSFLILLIAMLIVGSIVNFAVGWVVKRGSLTMGDRFLGVIFGLVRGFVVVVLLVLVAGLTYFPQSQSWREATLLEPFVRGAKWAVEHLPPDVARNFSYDASVPEAEQS